MEAWRPGPRTFLAWVAIVAALLAPALATAKPHRDVQPRKLSLRLQLPASNGYSVLLETLGHHQVTLTASKGDVIASYVARGSVSRHRIDVDLGPLGQVSGRFSGSPFHPYRGFPLHRDCRGRRPIFEAGPFRGTIRFRGEHGYTRVSTHRAGAVLTRTFRRVCKPGYADLPGSKRRGERGRPPRALIVAFSAIDRSRERTVSFATVGFQVEGGKHPAAESEPAFLVFAGTEERLGRVAIERAALLIGAEGSVLLSPLDVRPLEATFAPPVPFAGTAAFHEGVPTGERWTGTLGVHLPGAGLVPLTGAGFKSKFCRAASEKQLLRCQRRQALAQISGSQSQLFGDARLSWSR